jgi:hypothetical protein
MEGLPRLTRAKQARVPGRVPMWAWAWAGASLVLLTNLASAARAAPRPAVSAPIGAPAVGAPASTGARPAPSAKAAAAAENGSNSCRRLPPGKAIVKLNLKPDTELGDLVAWIASITCKQFIIPGTIPSDSKKFTIYAPMLITPEEAYRLFLSALDSVGLTVFRTGSFLRIIETAKAKSSPIPFYMPSPAEVDAPP